MESSLFDMLKEGKKVGAFGSMNADYSFSLPAFPEPGSTVKAFAMNVRPGGKSSNQAVQAALLGMESEMFGQVGEDPRGEWLIKKLAEAGVETQKIIRKGPESGSAFIMVDPRGENEIVVNPGANGSLDEGYLEEVKADLSSLDALGFCLEVPVETVEKALREVEGPIKVLNVSPMPPSPSLDMARGADVVIVNEEEAKDVMGNKPLPSSPDSFLWGTAAKMLKKRGLPAVVITLGSKGSVALEEGKAYPIPSKRVSPKDTTGCGDSFAGSLLAGLASGMALADAARLASFASAFSALGEGAQSSYGTKEEIKKFAEE
ncbi:MAG: ribokinase [Aeriscardovia sp.]|nr:ribokinase [Aeriscardovia sp.]